MATTIALIADAAFDAVEAGITDAIATVTITRVTQGAYNFATGAYAETTASASGRGVLDSVKPVEDVFPYHIRGPKDQLWLFEGFTSIREGDTATIGGVDYVVAAVQGIAGAGTLFYAVVQ